MKNCLFLLIGALLALSWSCSDDDKQKSSGTYDPDKPIEVETFMPDSGRLREKFILKGSNFGTDVSKVKVYFIDATTERIATVIGVDNNTIYCLAPRQLPGNNQLKIVVDGREAPVTGKTFKYMQVENVSTVAGRADQNKVVDGSLTDARFSYSWGIAALGNESMLVFQKDNACVRLLSIPDNKVTTVHPGFKGGKPAVTRDRQVVYAVALDKPHAVYMYSKGAGWAPSRIGQLGTDFDLVLSVALDETEKWLYFIDKQHKFARFSLENQTTEVITADVYPGESKSDNGVYLVYNPITGCFYMSNQKTFKIYQIKKDGTCEVFAGSNMTAVIDGYGTDAAFKQPNGMTVDEDGNIYIVEGSAAYVLRKITISDRYVSTIAGKKNVASQIDGTPLDATFNYPYDISYDGDGNYWIAEGWGAAVRKYAIE